MTDDDLTRLRDEVAGVTWRHKIVRPDGDPVTLCVCLTWSKGRGSITADDRAHNEHLADALLPLLTRKIAEAWNAGYCTNRDPSAVKLAHLHNPYMQAPEGEEQ